MSEDRKDPPPGAIPNYVSPQQVTAPLPTGQPPWSYPHFSQPAPQVDLRPKQTWHDVIKTALSVVGVVITVGGIIFAAGQLAGDFRAFKVETSKRQDQQDVKINQAVESSQKTNSAVTDMVLQMHELNERLRNVRVGRQQRRQHDPADQVLPPGP